MRNVLAENSKIIMAISPATNGSGLNGQWVTLKNAGLCHVLVTVTQGHADPVALSIEQAVNVAGDEAKALDVDIPIWSNLSTAASDALIQRDDDVEYDGGASLASKLVVFQLDPATLDHAGGFTCIRVVAAASDAANIISATYILTNLRNQSRADDLPSAIVD